MKKPQVSQLQTLRKRATISEEDGVTPWLLIAASLSMGGKCYLSFNHKWKLQNVCWSINPFVMKNLQLNDISWWYKPGTKKLPLCIYALRSTCLGDFILELLYHFQYWQIHFSTQIFVLLQPFPTICLSSSTFLLFCGSPYLLLSTGISTALHSHPLHVILVLEHLRPLGQCIPNYFPTSASLPDVCLCRYCCQSFHFGKETIFLTHNPHLCSSDTIWWFFTSL